MYGIFFPIIYNIVCIIGVEYSYRSNNLGRDEGASRESEEGLEKDAQKVSEWGRVFREDTVHFRVMKEHSL